MPKAIRPFNFLTDGVAISLTCKKTIQWLTDEQRRKMILKKLAAGLYKFIFGLDPGYRLTLGGVRRGVANAFERNIHSNILKCGKFYQCSREFHRNKKKKKLDTDLQKKLTEDRKRFEFTPSSKRWVSLLNLLELQLYTIQKHCIRFVHVDNMRLSQNNKKLIKKRSMCRSVAILWQKKEKRRKRILFAIYRRIFEFCM